MDFKSIDIPQGTGPQGMWDHVKDKFAEYGDNGGRFNEQLSSFDLAVFEMRPGTKHAYQLIWSDTYRWLKYWTENGYEPIFRWGTASIATVPVLMMKTE